MKQLILWFSVFNWFALSYGQTSLWGTCTQSDYTNEATSTAFDANNNLYVAGYVTGEVAFNANVTFPNAQGNGDIYIAKYNVSGSLVWVRKFGGPMPDRAYGLAVDNLGNVLVTGQFFGEVDFDGTVLQSVANSKDIFLVKLNTLGNVIWARSEGGNLGDNVYGIATDGENNIILTGQFEGTANIGNQTFNSMINPQLAVPSYDLFISKYNSLGTPLWAISGTAKYEDRALAVKTDINNNIYVSGQFSDTLNLNGNIYDNIGFNIGFLAKLNPAGSTMWFNKITAGLVIPYDLDINIAGEIYLCGDFLGALIHQGTTGSQTLSNPFSRKVFVSKVNDSGGVIWQRALGSNNELSARGIAVSLDDKVYVTGHFRCALSELQEQNDATFNSVGFRDIYLWTLNDIGVVLSTKQMGGKKNDYSYDVALRSNLTPFICGSFTNNLNIPISSSASYTFANDAFSMSSLSSMQWLYFHGDQSVNSFVTGALFADSPTYNYFLNQPSDSLFGYIAQNGSLTFCEEDEITYVTQTHTNTGPGYDFLWNTGSTNQTIYAPTSGDYFVSVDRWDECVGYADTVFVNPLPNLPLLSDDIVEYTNAIIQEQGIDLIEYDRCAPDTFNIWFTPILPNETILISGPQTSYTDVNPNPYFASGLHSVVVTDEFCSHVGLFTINHDFVEENEIDPLPIFTDPEIENDTLIICQFEWSPIRVVDLLTNPNADISIIPDINVVSESFSINVNGANVPTTNPEDYFGFFQATTTGWYILNYELTTGYDNTCGIDTLYNQRFDSLYVIVNPLPSGFTTLALGSLLCPNGSVFITASNTFPNFSWSGPTIDWVSPNTDSAQVSEAGMYYYSGLLVDPVTGCTNSVSASILLIEKLPPLVITDPEDAIICPYDLVTFTVPNIYLDYNWTGPSGTSLSVTNTHIDTEMGFYFCTVLDDEGCYLTTPPVEIQEYSTPFLYLEPYNIICPGESLTISAFFSGIGSVNWLSPIVGNMQEITVSAPGWYSAELTACGITTIDSIFIIDGAFTVNISASDSILCFASTVLIQGDYQTGVYEWSNGMFGGANIQINEAGSYWASVTNEFGCIANSNTVDILFSEFSAPPDSYEITICVASEVTLNTSLNELVVWYDENLNALDTALTYTDFFDASVQFFVAYPQSLCPPVFGEISVILDPPILADYFILGESILCSDSDAEYSSNWTGDIAWFIDGNPSGNNPSVFINSVDYSDSIVLSASLSNSCYDTIIFLVVDVLPPFIMNLPFTDTTVCPYSEFMLPLGSIYSELFILNDTYFTTISELPIAVEETQLLFNVYGILENGCATDTVLVTINIFQVQLDIDIISSPNCVTDTLILSANSGQTIIWSYGSSIVEANTLVLPIELAGPYLILATYIDSNGCEDSTEFYFNILETPILADYFILGESILCSDSDAEYSSNWTGDIAWFIDGNPAGNNPSVFINSEDYSGSIVLSASLSNSCYDTIIFLVIDVLPPFIMNLPFTDTTVCPYSEFMLPLGSIYSELFILNDTYFTTISELPIAVEETQLLFNMYGILENGCATDTVLVTINIHQVQLDIDTISYPNCVPDTLILSTNSGQMIIWSNGSSIVEADTLVLPIELAGPYLILATYTDSNGCEASTEFYFNVYNAINIPVLSDTIVCENTYFYTSFWVDMTTGVPIFSALDSVLILSNQTIEYTVSNEFDCPFSGTINVIAINCDTELPNVITPNGDGVNDYFRIERALIEPGNHLVILNRWGSVIFETLGYQNTFNASGVTEGAYFYVYTPKYADPNSEPIKGILHVIR